MKKNKSHTQAFQVLSLASLGLVALLCREITASPLIIPAGEESFATSPGSLLPLPPIPGGFITFGGEESLPIPGQHIPVTGGPDFLIKNLTITRFFIGSGCHRHPSGGQHCYEQVTTSGDTIDTIVKRPYDAVLDSIGDTTTVPLELFFLSVQGLLEIPFPSIGPLLYHVNAHVDTGGVHPQGTVTYKRVSEGEITATTTLVVTLSSLDFEPVTIGPTPNPLRGVPLGDLDGEHDPFCPNCPEPATWLLLGTGLIGLVGYSRRRRTS